MTLKIFSILFIFSISYCKTPQLSDLLNKRISESYHVSKNLDILYVTTRDIAPGQEIRCSNEIFFPTIQDKTIKSGSCLVNVPSEHPTGKLDVSDKEDARDKFYKFISHKKLDLDSLLQEVKSDSFPEVIVFVHGFNVEFEEAILRSAQIKYDLKFPGRIVVFTWPAGAGAGLVNQLNIKGTYDRNLQNATGSRVFFQEFLTKISQSGKKIHLMAHSMGHQVVLPSLSKLGSEGKTKIIHELVLNAPDFPVEEFDSIRQNVKKTAERITLYCSPADRALIASNQMNKNKRLGSCNKFPELEVVNVNAIDVPLIGLGHGYYATRPIITDLYQLFMGVDVKKRLFIREANTTDEDYFLKD